MTPGALAPAITDGLLRDQLGFKGVAITDDLSSGAIAAGQGAPEAARSALAAGADLIVVGDPADAKRPPTALLQAARSGAVPTDRLEQAVARPPGAEARSSACCPEPEATPPSVIEVTETG